MPKSAHFPQSSLENSPLASRSFSQWSYIHSSIPKFVFASTSSSYGVHNPVPYSENTDTSQPISPYAASKKAAQTLCYSYHHSYGVFCDTSPSMLQLVGPI